MRKNLLLVLAVFSLVLSFSRLGFSQVNEYILVPVDLQVSPVDSTVQVNINVKTIELIFGFLVPLFAEGTCNPVLDTILTGGSGSPNPPAFYPPSLVANSAIRTVYQYGPPLEPMYFFSYHEEVYNDSGLWCRMFYKVSGPGTLTFRTAIGRDRDTLSMFNGYGSKPINWPIEGVIDSFEVTADAQRGDANYDGKLTVADIVYLISYLFKGGPPPFVLKAGDINCDGRTTVTDVIYLLNYLFKGGPPSPC